MKTPIVYVVWGLTLCAAFFAGRQGSTQTEVKSVPPRPSEVSEKRMTDRLPSGQSVKGRASTREKVQLVKSGESPEEMIQHISLMSDSLARTAALTELLENTRDSAEFYALVDSFRELGMTQERMGEYNLMLSAWAKMDPLGALSYASEKTGTPYARQTILATWAGDDPPAAIRWAVDNHDGDGANLWMVGVIRGIASSDITLASTLMTDLPRSRERGQALESLVQQFSVARPDEAIDWVSSLQSDDSLRNAAQNRVAALIAEKDLETAVEWMDTLSQTEGARRNAIDEVTAVWAKEDPDAAIAYANQLPEAERGQAAEGILRSLASEDPVKAESYLASLEGTEDLGEAIQNFVWGSYEQAPELAAPYISSINNNRRRNRAYRRVLDRWNQRDPAAVAEWVAASDDLPDNLRRRYSGE